MGAFAILVMQKMKHTEILSLHYTHQKIDQVFDVVKSYADLLPP